MTDTITAPALPQAGTIHHIDPREVVVGTNVRLDPRLDKAFIESVRAEGVLVPIVGHHDDDGRFVVLYGQRRTLAAVEAGRDTIPAYVVDGLEDADRLVRQMAENDHRAALTTGERAKGYEQLSALGLTANQIAKRTATPKADVEHGLSVAKSELAGKALAKWDFLTLEQGAALAEFDDDPEAVKSLTVAASQGRFDHTAQRMRDAREETRLRDEFTAALREQGIKVIDKPGWDNKDVKTLDYLRHDGERVTPESHAACPGHAAFVTVGWENLALDDDEEEDEEEEEEDYDEDGEEHEEPEQERVRTGQANYVCTDWRKHGHIDRYASATSKKSAADMTGAEREKAAAERRDVIDSNKAWRSAETVRRQWLTTFLTRKTPPKGTGPFLARTLVDHAFMLADNKSKDLRRELLAEPKSNAVSTQVVPEPRAFVLALGHVLASYEAQTGVHSWRSVNSGTAGYLRFLAANGYTLSDVEERACAKVTK